MLKLAGVTTTLMPLQDVLLKFFIVHKTQSLCLKDLVQKSLHSAPSHPVCWVDEHEEDVDNKPRDGGEESSEASVT